jgi:hypothetical protein
MAEEQVAQLKSLIGRLREAKGIVPGVSQQHENPDFGMIGQFFEDLLYFHDDHRSWAEVLGDSKLVSCMIEIAHKELALQPSIS